MKVNSSIAKIRFNNVNLINIDEDFIISEGLEKGVDFISVSFVRKGEDIEYVKDLLSPRGEHIKIIAKIENVEGLENFEDILKSADGIMVAR